MGSVSVSSCRCCVSCVHPVAVLNAIGDHTEEAYSRAGLITACLLLFTPSCCSECFYDL